MKPFKIRHPSDEIPWIKSWFRAQIVAGRVDFRSETVSLASSEEDVRRLIDTLDDEGRKRLQKALSVRRARAKSGRPRTMVELTTSARDALRVVAEHRGCTMSSLIEDAFGEEYEHIKDREGTLKP